MAELAKLISVNATTEIIVFISLVSLIIMEVLRVETV